MRIIMSTRSRLGVPYVHFEYGVELKMLDTIVALALICTIVNES